MVVQCQILKTAPTFWAQHRQSGKSPCTPRQITGTAGRLERLESCGARLRYVACKLRSEAKLHPGRQSVRLPGSRQYKFSERCFPVTQTPAKAPRRHGSDLLHLQVPRANVPRLLVCATWRWLAGSECRRVRALPTAG